MTVRPVFLDAGDPVELGELKEFLCGWLDCDSDCLAGSFRRFVGGGYDVDGLRADLSRFAFLLGGNGLDGDGPITVTANRYLAHLSSRAFSPATVPGLRV